MYALLDSLPGSSQLGMVGTTPDSAQRMAQGQLVTANDPYWGTGEFVYCYAQANIRAMGIATILPAYDSTNRRIRWQANEVPNTANTGKMIGICIRPLQTGEYGWFLVSGVTPVASLNNLAFDQPIGIGGVGVAATVSAGKQLTNARTMQQSTFTSAKVGYADAGSNQLTVNNTDGWFVGIFLSGTGIAAGTTVTGVDPSGRFVTLSANTTAQVNGTVTGTYNDGTTFYNVACFNRTFVQGQIT